MPKFLIEGDAVHRQAGNLHVTVTDFRAVLDSFRVAVEHTYGTWLGTGTDAFRAFSGRYQTTAQNLITAQETLRAEVDTAGIAYDQNEAQQQAAVGKLTQPFALPGATTSQGISGGGNFAGGGNLTDVGDVVGDAADGVADALGDAVDGAAEALGDAVEFAGDVAEDIGDALSDAAEAVGDVAEDAGDFASGMLGGLAAAILGDTVRRLERSPMSDVDFTDSDGDGEPDNVDDDDGRDGDGDGQDSDAIDNDGDGQPDADDDDDGKDSDGDGQDEDDISDDGSADRNGHWESTDGPTPDPEEVSAEDARAHILYGDGDGRNGGHRHDSGVPNKTTFPEDWNDDEIIENVEDVAKNPDEPPVYNEDDGVWTVHGTRTVHGETVDIEVIVKPDGDVKTGYPTGGDGVHRNDENGDPQPR